MNKTLINDPFRNPFHNRFHVPVHSRLDEMQSHAQVVWLYEPATSDQQTKTKAQSRPLLRALAGLFALVLAVVFSAAFLATFVN